MSRLYEDGGDSANYGAWAGNFRNIIPDVATGTRIPEQREEPLYCRLTNDGREIARAQDDVLAMDVLAAESALAEAGVDGEKLDAELRAMLAGLAVRDVLEV